MRNRFIGVAAILAILLSAVWLRGCSSPHFPRVEYPPEERIFGTPDVTIYDNTVILWYVSNISQPSRIATLIGHTDKVYRVAFSPDGKMLVSGSNDETIILWNLANPNKPQRISVLVGHNSYVSSLAFSPTGNILASGGADSKIILWDLTNLSRPSKMALLSRNSLGVVGDISFSPDGKTLASSSGSGGIVFWELDSQSWISKACLIAGSNFTLAEWQQYFPREEYHITCPQWPAGE